MHPCRLSRTPEDRAFQGKLTCLVLNVLFLSGFFIPLPALAGESAAVKMESWKKSARNGSVTAPYQIGTCYQHGNGVKKDPAKAVTWYRLGARRGDFQAALALADMYLSGEGTEQNEEKAVYWYVKLGKSNTEFARPARTRLLMLARNYALGEDGVKADPVRARNLFQRLLKMEQAGQAEIIPAPPGLPVRRTAKR